MLKSSSTVIVAVVAAVIAGLIVNWLWNKYQVYRLTGGA